MILLRDYFKNVQWPASFGKLSTRTEPLNERDFDELLEKITVTRDLPGPAVVVMSSQHVTELIFAAGICEELQAVKVERDSLQWAGCKVVEKSRWRGKPMFFSSHEDAQKFTQSLSQNAPN